MKNKIITVDCDGVIMENIGGRNWTNQSKNESETTIYKTLNLAWATFNHQWRRPLPGIEEALIKLKNEGYKLVLVTSRKEYLQPLTMRWLKKWGLEKYFEGFYFNNFGTTAVESKVRNLGQIGPIGHIDDNEETVKELNLKFPPRRAGKNLRIFWLCKTPSPADAGVPLQKGDDSKIIKVGSWGEIREKL
ncbi:HAD hydrolase-like protein [Candidatus Shapirobacteria bacterium]|nr:HAD hydrolase-like protein [Candidatus Shapirobacteria bacterium]